MSGIVYGSAGNCQIIVRIKNCVFLRARVCVMLDDICTYVYTSWMNIIIYRYSISYALRNISLPSKTQLNIVIQQAQICY